jgi:predicted enzyme related to lactoylglutathione lyase
MRRRTIVLSVGLVLAVWCGSTARLSAEASTPSTSQRASPTTTTVAPITLPIESVPSTTTSGSDNPGAPTGKVLMVKLYVGSLDAGEKFYGAVFGATLALKLGDTAHVVTFPGGGPGLVLLKTGPQDKRKHGSFIIQVPNLSSAQALAVANGAKEQRKFAGNPGGQAAQSIDFLDPWGNQVEILQIG